MDNRFRVVTWLWGSIKDYRTTYTIDHVNILYNMVSRHLHIPFEFVLVTDKPNAKGLNPNIRVIPIDWPNPCATYGDRNKPNCLIRLKMFSEEAKDLFGPRFLSLDLDCVILNDITPLVVNDLDFKIWAGTHRITAYNGGMVLLNAGTRLRVWNTFRPDTFLRLKPVKGKIGSDQAWYDHVLGPDEAKWTTYDGVYSFPIHIQAKATTFQRDSNNIRIAFFHGAPKPWDLPIKRAFSWLTDHYH